MEAIGNTIDLTLGFAPVDMTTAANTGARVRLARGQAATFVLFKGVGTAGQDPVITVQEHNAYTGGTSANLAVIDHYYVKDAVALTGADTWSKVTQTAAATITDPGGNGTSAEHQQIVAVTIEADWLTAGYEWVNFSVADVGANSMLGCCLVIVHDLNVKRAPALMPGWLTV
jgi:hypothetical protein